MRRRHHHKASAHETPGNVPMRGHHHEKVDTQQLPVLGIINTADKLQQITMGLRAALRSPATPVKLTW
jgi:hypothetical protein